MIEEVFKDIYRIEIPLPENPLKSLNAYIIKGTRNLLIDTGFNRLECQNVIEDAFETLDINLENTDIFITHLHSDHCGLATKFKTGGNRIYCGKIDGLLINQATTSEYWNELDELFIKYGFPRKKFGSNTDIHPGRKFNNEEKIDFDYVEDGDKIEVGAYKLTCVWTPGHTPGHMCLYDEEKQLIVSGDHILGDITPNICIEIGEENPLKSYFESLKRIKQLPIKTILTAHRKKVDDAYERIGELVAHHELRLAEVIKILEATPANAYEVAQSMTWQISCKRWKDFPSPQKWFATGEAISHLQYLESIGSITREERLGVYTYRIIKT